jgi:hypothetical protein
MTGNGAMLPLTPAFPDDCFPPMPLKNSAVAATRVA